MNSIFTQYLNNRYYIITLTFINSLFNPFRISFPLLFSFIFLCFTVDYMHFKTTYSYTQPTVQTFNVLEYSQVDIHKNTSKFSVIKSYIFYGSQGSGNIILLQGREYILKEGRDNRLCMQPNVTFILCIYGIMEPESQKGPQRVFNTVAVKVK